eukprot:10897403-Alexandrium_andersonii.AAC.1
MHMLTVHRIVLAMLESVMHVQMALALLLGMLVSFMVRLVSLHLQQVSDRMTSLESPGCRGSRGNRE